MPQTVKLAVSPYSQTDVFVPSIEGVEPITKEGTDVPKDLEKSVRKAARSCGVSLRAVRA